MRCLLPIIGVTVVLLLVRFMKSHSDILLSPPTGSPKSMILQSRSNGVTALVNRAAVCYDVKHPMIIPQDHQLCRLVIMNCHRKLNHEGTEHVRNELRLWYWIPHSRSTARKVLNDCSSCKRRRNKPQIALMASLPKDRLQVTAPFSKVGVDYFGPITVNPCIIKKNAKGVSLLVWLPELSTLKWLSHWRLIHLSTH